MSYFETSGTPWLGTGFFNVFGGHIHMYYFGTTGTPGFE